MNRDKGGRLNGFMKFSKDFWQSYGGEVGRELMEDSIQENNRVWWERNHPENDLYKSRSQR